MKNFFAVRRIIIKNLCLSLCLSISDPGSHPGWQQARHVIEIPAKVVIDPFPVSNPRIIGLSRLKMGSDKSQNYDRSKNSDFDFSKELNFSRLQRNLQLQIWHWRFTLHKEIKQNELSQIFLVLCYCLHSFLFHFHGSKTLKQNWEMKQNWVKQNWVGTVFTGSQVIKSK